MGLETLRVLSGLIIPLEDNRENGTAVIDFNPHGLQGDVQDPNVEDIQSMGPSGPFLGEPNKILALREISGVHIDDDHFGSIGFEEMGYRIDDEFFRTGSRQGLEVEWETMSNVYRDAGGSRGGELDENRPTPVEIREISYLIIGEVDEDASEYDDYEGSHEEDDR